MFKGIRKLFSRIQKRPHTLNFYMDVNEQGESIVTIKKVINGSEKTVENIDDFLIPYYFEEVEGENYTTIYYLSENDRQKIFSLKSLNPKNNPDGSLSFEVEPPILNYLRKKNITETDTSKSIVVVEERIKPTAIFKYNPKQGGEIKFGYQVDSAEPLKSIDEIRYTKDGQYARVGNKFARIADVSDQVKNLLERKKYPIKEKEVPEFILRDLVFIRNNFTAVLVDHAQNIQVIEDQMTPLVSINKDPQGWLDFEVKYSTANYEFPIELLQKSISRKENFIQVNPLTWVKIDQKSIKNANKRLANLDATLIEGGYRLPPSEFASLEEFIDSIGGLRTANEAYTEFLEQLSGFSADDNFKLPSEFEKHLLDHDIKLRTYQRAGIHWLDWLRKNHLHGVLADDMGLGKTIQSLSAMRLAYNEMQEEHHSLIIAPYSVLVHWEREIERVFNSYNTYIYHGNNRKSKYLYSKQPFIFITTYGTIVNDIEILAKIPFFYLIVDEASKIKNPGAKRSQAIKSLNARHRIALSGTPVENRPAELWSLFDFLMKGHLGSYNSFITMFENPIMQNSDKAYENLGRKIRPFLLRRMKEEVETELPPKIIIDEWVNLSDEQRNLYAGMQDALTKLRDSLQRSEKLNYTTSILPILTKLIQICDHPGIVTGKYKPILGRSDKFDAAIEKIEESIDNNGKVIVFSRFLAMLTLIETIIKQKKIPYIRIDGSTSNRQSLVDEFNQGTAKVAILSLMAASYGINLASANNVIHVDRWWNPAIEGQATDRAHRIGQKNTVFVYTYNTQGTLEEKIDRLLKRKKQMANNIINSATSKDLKWSRSELLEILKPIEE